MRVAVLGAAAAAVLGGAVAISPLSAVDKPTQASTACTVASCERMASVLVPQTGPTAAPAPAAIPAPPAPIAAPARPVPPAPLLGQPAAARVIAPALVGPPAAPPVPALAAPTTPGQPTTYIPGTQIPIPPELMNQANAVVNALVAAQASQAAGPIIGGVVGGASGLISAVASLGGTGVTLVFLLNQLNQLNNTGNLTTANLVKLLVPGANVLEQLDPAVVAQLNSVNLSKLTSIPAIQAALPMLRNLPPPVLPSPQQVLEALHNLPPPPPLPPPPVICGPWIGWWLPCI